MNEQQKIKEILLNLPVTKRRFRINSGTGWIGEIVSHKNGMILLKNPRPLKAAPKGWPDLVGWDEIEITADMVGKKIAVFSADEVKMTGKLSIEQKSFLKILELMGGNANVVYPD